jgi:hypothetical protein
MPYGPMPGGMPGGDLPPGAMPTSTTSTARGPAARNAAASARGTVQNVPYSGQGSMNYAGQRRTPQYGASAPAPVVTNGDPAFIGPRGYDVIEYKK